MKKTTRGVAISPEARHNQLINLAVDEAERRLRNGTASSQIITTLLNFASVKARLELEKMRSDISLAKAKEKEITDKANNSELYAQALEAFKSYRSNDSDVND